MAGKQFGEWTVLEDLTGGKCLCRCSCGKEKIVLARSLRTGKSTSCGHNKLKEDLTGKVYGNLTVKEYVGDGRWLCECICGNTKEVRGYDLKNNNVTSCGHKKISREEMIGKRYGSWTVIGLSDKPRYVKCKCYCGTESDIHSYSLTNGTSTNCGCKRRNDLTGETFAELTVLEHDGNWCTCKCSCNSIIRVRARALLSGNTRSCGCKTVEFKRQTMLDRYGETTAARINNPRDQETLDIIYNKEKFISMLDEYTTLIKRKPTLLDISTLLGINSGHTLNRIRQYGLEDKIRIGVYGQEQERLAQFIRDLGLDVIINDRKVLNGLELDIYIPSKNMAIEYNGSHWHNSERKDITYHQDKTIEAAKAGIRLIHIFDYEWKNIEMQNKLAALLQNALTNNNTRIFARNTELNKIDTKEETRFLNENHLQGYARSLVCYGLQHNNELVAIMSFGRPRFNNQDKYEYELIRLAFKQGINIVGGAEKLFNAFIKEYNPSSIVSYCDISKFSGNVYTRLGFTTTVDSFTSPNYVWVNKDASEVLPRYKTMKHKLIEQGLGTPSMTENEIMESIGYTKIFDCGNLRFIWER